MKLRRVRVRVPATTANLGPGFDCLGMALDIHNSITVEANGHLDIQVSGEGEGQLPRGERNLAYRSLARVFARVGRPVPSVRILARNDIPLGRGLGSSASAVIAGLLAGNTLLGSPLDEDELLRLAWQIEGHPDNVAPALLGGCVVSVVEAERVVWARVPVPADLSTVVFVPAFTMSTEASRAVLPATLSRSDSVFNIGRVALLVAALSTGDLRHLSVATQDRLHQPARQTIFPALYDLLEAAMREGALGAFLSGAGSSVLALARGNEEQVAAGLKAAAVARHVAGHTLITRPSAIGSRVESLDTDG